MKIKNLSFKISPDENNIVTLENGYQFRSSSRGCCKCDLLNHCMSLSGNDGNPDFPFPCLPENRKDKQNGIFLSLDSINRRNNVSVLIIVIFFIALAILVYFNVIPNFLKILLCLKK